jgi:nucleoside-triphosphatase
MPTKSSHILITGLPGSGKTTLIKRLAAELPLPYRGFFTGAIRVRGQRQGFEIESFSGQRAVMAHVDIDSPHKVSKYGVDLAAFEKIALPELEVALANRELLIIDEIGKMELFSQRFQELLLDIFKADMKLLATIMYKDNQFCDRLKAMPGIRLYTVSKSGPDFVTEILKELI